MVSLKILDKWVGMSCETKEELSGACTAAIHAYGQRWKVICRSHHSDTDCPAPRPGPSRALPELDRC